MPTLSERLAASEAKLQDSESMRKRLRMMMHEVVRFVADLQNDSPSKHARETAPQLETFLRGLIADDGALGYSDDAGEQGEAVTAVVGYKRQWKCLPCGALVPLGGQVSGPKHRGHCKHWAREQGTPGDAAAEQEHAANSEPAILAERIDFLNECIAQYTVRLETLEDRLPIESLNTVKGRIDACMEAIANLRCKDDVIEQQLADIRRRLDARVTLEERVSTPEFAAACDEVEKEEAEPGASKSVEGEARSIASMAATLLSASDCYSDHIHVSNQVDAVGTATDVLRKARAAVRKERENG